MPGFAAESSLGPAMGRYIGKSVHLWSSTGFAASITSISPQQLSVLETSAGRDCFGSLRQCIADHCVDVDITAENIMHQSLRATDRVRPLPL